MLPESTFLSPVNVCVSSSFTSVSAEASSPPPPSSDPPQAERASARTIGRLRRIMQEVWTRQGQAASRYSNFPFIAKVRFKGRTRSGQVGQGTLVHEKGRAQPPPFHGTATWDVTAAA